jgi:hypothetical protein
MVHGALKRRHGDPGTAEFAASTSDRERRQLPVSRGRGKGLCGDVPYSRWRNGPPQVFGFAAEWSSPRMMV